MVTSLGLFKSDGVVARVSPEASEFGPYKLVLSSLGTTARLYELKADDLRDLAHNIQQVLGDSPPVEDTFADAFADAEVARQRNAAADAATLDVARHEPTPGMPE